MIRRLIGTIVLPTLVTIGLPSLVHATAGSLNHVQPPQPPAQQGVAPRPGDLFWEFASTGPLADQRIELAFAMLVGAHADSVLGDAGVDGSRRLFYGDEEVRRFAATPGSLADAGPLLDASGITTPGGPTHLRERRTCRVWTPTGDEARAAVAAALGRALAATLHDLGVEAQPCELVTASDGADVFVWEFGQNLHVNAAPGDFDAPSFLEITVELPGRVPGGTGGAVAPPTTGSAGLAAATRGDGTTGSVAALIVASVLLAACARGVTTRTRSGR